MHWKLIGGLAGGAAYLVGRAKYRRSHQRAAARAAGLEAIDDLSQVSAALQRTALWALADGGFERRVVHGMVSRPGGNVALTAFDLETLRERRGEWAFLPVEPPFRIAGVVSAVVCDVDRAFPHMLFKRAGIGDELIDDDRFARLSHVMKNVRDTLGVSRSYPAELPPTLPSTPLDLPLPPHWRGYSHAASSSTRCCPPVYAPPSSRRAGAISSSSCSIGWSSSIRRHAMSAVPMRSPI